ncbi:MAG: PQQ-binding-like beta-propeller repeat protein [Phycisphaerae bacterium]
MILVILGAVMLLAVLAMPANAQGPVAPSMQQLWSNLASDDVDQAFESVTLLEAQKARAVAWLSDKLVPAQSVSQQQIHKLVHQLSSASFADRRQAHQELMQLGAAAEPALREGLARRMGTEADIRIGLLLELAPRTCARTQEEQQTRFGIRLLERIGTAQAAEQIRKLADGADGARTTIWAREALSRLQARKAGRVDAALCGGSPSRSGWMGDRSVLSAKGISWRLDLGEFRYPSTGLTLHKGKAYFAVDHGDDGPRVSSYVYAIDLDTRKVLWTRGRANQVVRSAPAVQGDQVFYADIAHGQLVALDAADGQILWTRRMDLGMQSEPVPVGTTLYIAGDDNSVYAIDTQFGTEIWKHRTPAGVAWQIAADQQRVMVPSAEILQALDARTGKLLWQRDSGFLAGSCALVDGVVYFHSCQSWKGKGQLVAVEAESGQEKWSVASEGVSPHAPAVANGQVYFVAGDLEQIWAVDAENGRIDWRADLKAPLWYSPVAAGKRVYIPGRNNGMLYAVDTESGDLSWSIETDTRRLHGPVGLADGVLYFASRRRDVCAVLDQTAEPKGALASVSAESDDE